MTRRSPEAELPVVVKKSAIQGRGVFAKRSIKKGERIIEYVGERISHEEASKRYDDEGMRRHHTFLFSVNDDLCIDATASGNEARFINHCCEPNTEVVVVRDRVYIKAARDITPGDEIYYDYWYTTDESYTLEDLQRVYPCRCGAEACRGTLAAVEKPKKAKKKTANGESAAKRAQGKRNGSR